MTHYQAYSKIGFSVLRHELLPFLVFADFPFFCFDETLELPLVFLVMLLF